MKTGWRRLASFFLSSALLVSMAGMTTAMAAEEQNAGMVQGLDGDTAQTIAELSATLGWFAVDPSNAADVFCHYVESVSKVSATQPAEAGNSSVEAGSNNSTTYAEDSKAALQLPDDVGAFVIAVVEESEPVAPPWNLILVNAWNPIPDNYEIAIEKLSNGNGVDVRCYPDLQEMISDCKDAGLSPLICSSYRTQEKQETLFENDKNKLIEKGYSEEDAEMVTSQSIAVPGTSEHQLGLALDIVDISNQNLNRNQENTEVQKWLLQNSWKYGFILRYPSDKSELTGIIYEPWHYRYVGREAAKEIHELGICLEEYLAQ